MDHVWIRKWFPSFGSKVGTLNTHVFYAGGIEGKEISIGLKRISQNVGCSNVINEAL